MTRKLKSPHGLNYALVEDNRSYQMETLSDLQWFLFRCIDAKYEDGGRKKCLRVSWNCTSTTDEETRLVVQFIKERMKHKVVVDALVTKREGGRPTAVKFISTTPQCDSCDQKIDCLDTERI